MKIRSFINTKRFSNLGVNINTRTTWLLDYIKSMAKPLQVINKEDIEFEKTIKEYVDYNGQNLSLKKFVDDKFDNIFRRTLIAERELAGNYNFTGYFDYEKNEWVGETDVYQTNMGGYYENGEWFLEPEKENIILTGYYDYENKKWFKEEINDITISIMIHNDVYQNMTKTQKDKLYNDITRYIISPYRFEVIGYYTIANFNGIDDYIDTNIVPNANTTIIDKVILDGNFNFGIQDPNTKYYIGKTSTTFINGYGSAAYSDKTITDGLHVIELNGNTKKSYIDFNFKNTYNTVAFFDHLITTLKPGVFSLNGSNIYSAYGELGLNIIHNNINIYLVPHPDGYFTDQENNKYYNKNSTYNQYPLDVQLVTI